VNNNTDVHIEKESPKGMEKGLILFSVGMMSKNIFERVTKKLQNYFRKYVAVDG